MKVCRKEVFGPVVTIQAYDDLDEAIVLSNDTDYDLQAAFTSDLGKALKAARSLDFGGRAHQRSPDLARRPDAVRRRPRQRQHAGEATVYAVHEMTETRLIVISA